MTTNKRLEYQSPSFRQHDLKVVTLGGSSGADDSTPANTQPPSNSFGGDYADEWDDNFDSSDGANGY